MLVLSEKTFLFRRVRLPAPAADLERALRAFCDAHACWDRATVSFEDGHVLISAERE